MRGHTGFCKIETQRFVVGLFETALTKLRLTPEQRATCERGLEKHKAKPEEIEAGQAQPPMQ